MHLCYMFYTSYTISFSLYFKTIAYRMQVY